MADFEEIPLENAENIENSQNIEKEIPENTEIVEHNQEIPQEIPPLPKKKGRPVGAKNKAKPKPKTKTKAPVKKKVQYEEAFSSSASSSEEEEYNTRSRSQHTQPVYDSHAIASEVLSLLQQQKQSAKNLRRAHYDSWLMQM